MARALEASTHDFVKKSERILQAFQATMHVPTQDCCKNTHTRTREYCVLRLSDAWAQFCRDLMIKSARGGFTTSSGMTLSRAANSSNDVMSSIRALNTRLGRYQEPNWTISTEHIRIARQLGLANYNNVTAAIGSTNSPSEKLRRTRNYIAHKNADTAAKAIAELRVYGASPGLDIDAVLTSMTPHGVCVFEDWRNKLVNVAFSACN